MVDNLLNLHLNSTFDNTSPHVQHAASSVHSHYLNELHQLSLLSDITLHHETRQNFINSKTLPF